VKIIDKGIKTFDFIQRFLSRKIPTSDDQFSCEDHLKHDRESVPAAVANCAVTFDDSVNPDPKGLLGYQSY
jgi:hypothetical protein